MGWNDHDDRIMIMMDELEGYGVPYPDSCDIATAIRSEDMRSSDDTPLDALGDIADDYHAGETVHGIVKGIYT